jgi:hypothetical protein
LFDVEYYRLHQQTFRVAAAEREVCLVAHIASSEASPNAAEASSRIVIGG